MQYPCGIASAELSRRVENVVSYRRGLAASTASWTLIGES